MAFKPVIVGTEDVVELDINSPLSKLVGAKFAYPNATGSQLFFDLPDGTTARICSANFRALDEIRKAVQSRRSSERNPYADISPTQALELGPLFLDATVAHRNQAWRARVARHTGHGASSILTVITNE